MMGGMRIPMWLLAAGMVALALADDDMMTTPHTAVDLTDVAWSATLGSLDGNSPALIEFYASWCPHCRHYAPTYEKIARFFKSTAQKGGVNVFVGRVDCATEVKLCGSMKIPAYPHLTFGPAALFAARGNVSHFPAAHEREPKDVVEWVANMTALSELKYNDETAGVEKQPSRPDKTVALTSQAHTGPVWQMDDVEGATLQLWQMITDTPTLHTGREKRDGLLQLVRWWSAAHPSERCQASAQKLVAFFSILWPETTEVAPDKLRQYKICGEEAGVWSAKRQYVACQGSKPDSRGFTCALWLLFHASAARLPEAGMLAEGEITAQIMVRALKAFANHFFLCAVCQKHFSQVMARPEVDKLNTRKEAVLWLWRTHNEVNARLAEIEAKYGHSSSGDPKFPKIQWPDAASCPLCRKSGGRGNDWDELQMLLYLHRVFGSAPVAASMPVKATAHEAATLGRKGAAGATTPSDVKPSDESADEGGVEGEADAVMMGASIGAGTQLVIWPVVVLLGACAAACWWLITNKRGLAMWRALTAHFAPPPHKPYAMGHGTRPRGSVQADVLPTVATGLVSEAS